MIIFHMDLDNTIIYSYKRDIGVNKINAELYDGRVISYITEKTYALLKKLRQEILLVPTSTRTVEQYNRIDLKVGKFPYALVCNGGILLEDGKKAEGWYRESLQMVGGSLQEIMAAKALLETDERRIFELRFIEGLFLFTKCSEPERVTEELKSRLDLSLVNVFSNGVKVYVVPVNLDKGTAVKRFKKFLKADRVIAAGDSEFDIPMLRAADVGIAPFGFREKYRIGFEVKEAGENELLSEYALSYCDKMIRGFGVST